MQYLELKEMSFHGYHGIMEQEKKVGNIYTVDLRIYFDFTKAILSDNLEDTINYASVYEIIKKEMAIPSNLIENLAARIINGIKIAFPQIKDIKIRLAKRNPPFGGDIKEAAVIIS